MILKHWLKYIHYLNYEWYDESDTKQNWLKQVMFTNSILIRFYFERKTIIWGLTIKIKTFSKYLKKFHRIIFQWIFVLILDIANFNKALMTFKCHICEIWYHSFTKIKKKHELTINYITDCTGTRCLSN